MPGSKERIAQLNDDFRKTLIGGQVMMTNGVNALPGPEKARIVSLVRTFNDFSDGNDPYGEHDFGVINRAGEDTVYFKIDYYDKAMKQRSEDPADPKQTTRVMTIMLAHEY